MRTPREPIKRSRYERVDQNARRNARRRRNARNGGMQYPNVGHYGQRPYGKATSSCLTRLGTTSCVTSAACRNHTQQPLSENEEGHTEYLDMDHYLHKWLTGTNRELHPQHAHLTVIRELQVSIPPHQCGLTNESFIVVPGDKHRAIINPWSAAIMTDVLAGAGDIYVTIWDARRSDSQQMHQVTAQARTVLYAKHAVNPALRQQVLEWQKFLLDNPEQNLVIGKGYFYPSPISSLYDIHLVTLI